MFTIIHNAEAGAWRERLNTRGYGAMKLNSGHLVAVRLWAN